MNVDAYLKRIQHDEVRKLDLETLSQLQMKHLLSIPFENLDVMRKVEIPLDVETYYTKVVENNRGGFCYELNGLFHWLLESLGYKTHLIASKVRGEDGTWTMEGSHATLIVQLDQPYLVDVGFGDSARKPLPLTGEVHHDVSGSYRIIPVEENTYDLQRIKAGSEANEWATRIRFNTASKQLIDFKEPCHFNQTSPDSHFTRGELVTIATEEGRITFSDDTLTITHQGIREETPISNDEKAVILQKYFGIQLEQD